MVKQLVSAKWWVVWACPGLWCIDKVWNGPRCCSSAPTQKNNDSHLYFRINPLDVQRFVRGICEKHSFTHRSDCIWGVECYHCLTPKNLQEESQRRIYRVSQPGINCGVVSTLLFFRQVPCKQRHHKQSHGSHHITHRPFYEDLKLCR